MISRLSSNDVFYPGFERRSVGREPKVCEAINPGDLLPDVATHPSLGHGIAVVQVEILFDRKRCAQTDLPARARARNLT